MYDLVVISYSLPRHDTKRQCELLTLTIILYECVDGEQVSLSLPWVAENL